MDNTAISCLLSRIKEEYKLKHSDFMEKIIFLNKSIIKYYKRYYNKNILFYPSKFFKYLEIKKALKKEEYQNYINIYLDKNPGWFKSNVIPKNRKERLLEIIDFYGKKNTVLLNDYGFNFIDDNSTTFGWICWVKYWKFADNKSKEIVEVKF